MPEESDYKKKKADVKDVLAEFERKKGALDRCCQTTEALLRKCLQSAGVRFQMIQARVKDGEKLRDKYLDPKKNYQSLSDITDLAAIRVITYYEDEVDRAAEIIKREFEVDPDKSVDKRETDPEKFGYYALNLICRYSHARVAHVEYSEFTGIPFEVQITSILRHAWSEIEHPWYDLKEAFPSEIRRRFARMAALLEIAESEFLALRKVQSDYIESVRVRVAAAVPTVTLDAVSLRLFIQQEPIVRRIDKRLAFLSGRVLSEELTDRAVSAWLRLLASAGISTVEQLRELITQRAEWVTEYFEECIKRVWQRDPSRSPMQIGVCLAQLAIFQLCLIGPEPALRAITQITAKAPEREIEIGQQVEIANNIAAKYSNER
jgi:putative GTP pyrophosphokinase